MILLLLIQKTLAFDDIFSEFLSYGSKNDAMPLIHKSIYFIICLSITVFLVVFSYKKTALSALFVFYLLQLQIILFSFLPIHFRRSLRYFLFSYLVISILSVISIIYSPVIPIGILFHHSYFTWEILSNKILILLGLIISFSISYFYTNFVINLILLFYGSFFSLVLVKLIVLDRFNIRYNVRTRKRFNFRRDKRLVVIFILLLVANFGFQVYRRGVLFIFN